MKEDWQRFIWGVWMGLTIIARGIANAGTGST